MSTYFYWTWYNSFTYHLMFQGKKPSLQHQYLNPAFLYHLFIINSCFSWYFCLHWNQCPCCTQVLRHSFVSGSHGSMVASMLLVWSRWLVCFSSGHGGYHVFFVWSRWLGHICMTNGHGFDSPLRQIWKKKLIWALIPDRHILKKLSGKS